MLHHFARAIPDFFPPGSLIRGVTESSHIGVDLFFVLSGFLITTILLDSRDSPRYYRSFFGRRVLRILPLYYLFLVLVFYLLPALGLAQKSGHPLWFFLFAQNMLIVRSGWPIELLHPMWSIAIEEQFYLVWPGIVRPRSRKTLKRILIGVLLAEPLLRF